MDVELFIPCFIDQLYPETGFNTVKILEKLGCKVHYNTAQTCCGQPAFNAGFKNQAIEVAQKFLDDFQGSGDRFIVSPSASCVGMVRNVYEDLLKGENINKHYYNIQKNTFELSEFIVDFLEIDTIEGAKFPHTVTYHDSCSALRECGIKEAPRTLLDNVEGLELLEMEHTDTCCGFGGTFSVKFQGISVAMAEQKLDNANLTQADYLVSTDSSCLLHLDGYAKRNYKNIEMIHLADILASGW